MARLLRLLCLCWLACAAGTALARDPLDEPRFTAVGDTRSINDGVVTALAQDERKLIWIGTPVGLVRHDGYQLRSVPVGAKPEAGASPDAASGSSFVRSLLAAPGGVLWVGLEGEGLARLDTRSQAWTRYAPDPGRPGALGNGTVRALALDLDGALWVGTTGGGLHRLAPGTSSFQRHTRASGALPDDRVQSLCVDRHGSLWVGTWNGLLRLRRGAQRFEPVWSDPAQAGSLAGRIVSMLGEAPDGRIWAGTRQGELVLIDPASGTGVSAERAAPVGDGHSATTLSVNAMAVAAPDEVWVSSANGIELRDGTDGRIRMRLARDRRKPKGLAANNVVALLRERSGGVWVGSYGGGLQRYSPSNGLWIRAFDGEGDSGLPEADVRSLHQLNNGEIWAGLHEGGVAVLDVGLHRIGQILPTAAGRGSPSGPSGPSRPSRPSGLSDPSGLSGGRGGGPPSFKSGVVGAITQSTDGSVWVGSDSGIYQFTPRRQLLRRFEAGQGRARRMLATRDGSVWVGTQDGVYRRRPNGERFERLGLRDGGAVNSNINALAEGGDGSVWVGGNNGLYRVPAHGAALEPVSSPPDQGLLKTVVLGLLVDRHQVLWVDTNAGLHRLLGHDGARARFQQVAESDSPGGGSVGANLLDDAEGRIWTHQNVFDPRDGSRYELSPADGADIGTGWFRSHARLADGRMLIGGSAGILVVQADRFRRWDYAPPLVVSELIVGGERVPHGTPLKLTPEQRSFSVEFASLDFSSPERLRYRYRLKGVDAGWTETSADFRVATYGNLPPGDYLLEVQGSNRSAAWSPHTLALPVSVLPAWWQTWWARALAVAGLVQWRTALLRRRQLALEGKVRERTAALEALSHELQLKSAALEASSLTDPLTGLHNRRFIEQHLETDVVQAVRQHEDHRRRGAPLPDNPDIVFFLIDIDHFKQVNDQHGHAAGDAVLVQMRQRLQLAFRQADYLVRWGGEEFLIAARATSRTQAPELAERARAAVADTPFVLDDGTLLRKTCSVGFAAFPPSPDWPAAMTWPAVVDLADAALYAVKRGGRNGWLGVVQAGADSAAALQEAAAQPLARWAASGTLQVAASAGVAGWAGSGCAAPAEAAAAFDMPAAPA
jgi:diguanylate cyclase (GGDEF)-like protein